MRAGSNSHNSGGVAAQLKRIIIHENYGGVQANDIALIELKAPLPLSSPLSTNIKTIQIRREEVPAGSSANAFGWGRTNPSRSEDLKKLTAATLSQQDCGTQAGISSPLVVCLRRTNAPPCSGDSGGALVFNGQLIGIATVVRGCTPKPDVYTRLSQYAAWVTGHMR